MDEYTALEARVNHDGTVDVLIDGAAVPGGSGLTMEAVLELLTRFAAENGKLLMTTTHPNGRVTRDLVSETGEVTPFYPRPGTSAADPVKGARSAPVGQHDELYQALKQHGRRVGSADIARFAPVATSAPATTRVRMGEEAIPKFNVESDIIKAMSAASPPRSTAKTLILAVLITVLVLGGLAVAGWLFINGWDIRGPVSAHALNVPAEPLL